MQRIGSLFFCRIDKMGVNLGGLYVCMPHQGLNRVDVYAIFKQQRGVAMASTMTIKRNTFEMSSFSLFCQMSETQRSAEY